MSHLSKLQKELAYWRRVQKLRMDDARRVRAQGGSLDLYLSLARSYSRNAQQCLRKIRATGGTEQRTLL